MTHQWLIVKVPLAFSLNIFSPVISEGDHQAKLTSPWSLGWCCWLGPPVPLSILALCLEFGWKKSMQTCVDYIIWIIYFLVLVWIHSMGGTCGSRTQESEVLVSGSFLKGILCSLSISVSLCMCTCTWMHVHVHTHACTCAHRQITTEYKRECRILEPELQVFVSHPTWVTRTEFLPNAHTVWVLLPLGHLCISHFWYLVISIYHFILAPSLSWGRYRVVLEFSTLLMAPSLNPCYTVHPNFFVLEPALYRCYLWDGKGPEGKTQDRMKVKVSGHGKIKANWVEAEERKSCYLENHLGVTQVGALWSGMATDFV